MNTKARLLFIAVAATLLLAGVQVLSAIPVYTVESSISIAPSSIPIPETGTIVVGMNRVKLTTNFSGGETFLDSAVVQLISTGGFNINDVQSIKVWYEHNGGNTLFDNGASIDDHLVGSGTTFSPNPVTINLDQVITLVGGNSSVYLYVGVELKSSAATAGVSIGVQMTTLNTDKQTLPITPHAIQKPLDKYRVALTATNIAPTESKQGESASVLKLVLDPDDPNNSAAVLLESIKVHAMNAPRSDADLNSGGVVLYEDTNGNGTYDAGVDSQVTSATLGAVTPAYATLTPATAVTLPPTGKTFFVVVNISLTATVDNVIQLQIDNPSTDITFTDAYADEVSGGDYAYVPAGRAYVQEGYLLGITAVPSPNTPIITIKVQDIPQPPVVTSIVPGNNATNVDRATTVVAIFSKPMKVATINTTNFKLRAGATEVPSSVSLAGDNVTATLTPLADLEWGTTYTATVYGNGLSGVQDSVDDMFMAANKVWNFSTPPAVHPVVLSTSPMNSVIEVSRTTTVTATFSKDMVAASVLANFKLHDGTSFVGGSVSYDAPTRTATFTQTTPPLEWGNVYTASVDTGAVDTDGLNLEAKYSWTFTTTAAVYPIIVSRNPAHGAIEVDPADPLTATFSKDMDGTTINTTNCLLFKDNNTNNLYDAGDTLIARTVTLTSPQVVTITPSASLDWNTYYTIKVSTAVKDTEGLFMQNDSYWFFMTKVLRYPAVLGYSPANGAVGVARSASITVAFSKDMDDTTVDETTFLVEDGGGTPVSGAVSFDHDTFTATFDPDSDLAYATYNVTVKGGATGVEDTIGQPMAADVTWSFTTRPSLNEPVAANNRIDAANDHTMIFIPQPPASAGGADARVTVQVFTPTGKKVATLVNARRYSDLEDELPLLWYGINGRGEDLGPGLYFIRISATGWVRTLKVMVVR